MTTPIGRRLVATALAGAVLLTACGSGDDSADDEPAASSVEVAETPQTTHQQPNHRSTNPHPQSRRSPIHPPPRQPATDPPTIEAATALAALYGAIWAYGNADDRAAADPAAVQVADQSEPPEPPPAPVPADPNAFTVTSDVAYLTQDGVEYAMDIYTPVGEGPWPVVLNYHGIGTRDDVATAVVSQAAATNGFVVYTPSWVGDQFPFDAAVFDAWKDRANCSVAFAQEHAAANGGDATNTVLYGFSAGIGPVMFASQQPRTGPIDGCVTSTSPTPAVGAILGDGPYFLHDRPFDEVFEADPAGMQAEVTALVDPASWPSDLDARFFMWMPENDTGPRPIEDGSDWLSLRDPDGSIRADLDELGMLDDGMISNRDASRLLEQRLTDAGLDVTLDEYPGAHTTHDKALEMVAYMQAALYQ